MPVRFGSYVPYVYGCYFLAHDIIPLAPSLPTPIIPPAAFQGCRLLPVASSSAQCYPVGTCSFPSAQYSYCYGLRARNSSGCTPGLLLVAGVLVGVAIPLRIANMPINALLVEPWSNYRRYSKRWINLIKLLILSSSTMISRIWLRQANSHRLAHSYCFVKCVLVKRIMSSHVPVFRPLSDAHLLN